MTFCLSIGPSDLRTKEMRSPEGGETPRFHVVSLLETHSQPETVLVVPTWRQLEILDMGNGSLAKHSCVSGY